MELIVDRSVLHTELAALQGVVEKKNTIPVLSHILLHAEESDGSGRLKLAATDLELGVLCKLGVQCLDSGGITLSAKKLFEIVRSLPEADIQLKSADGRSVELSCGRSTYHLSGLPEGDFPVIPEPEADTWFTLPCKGIVRIVGQTIFSITTDENRFSIPGGLFVLSEDRMAVIGTDGHRLAYAASPLEKPGPEETVRALLPRKTLVELRRLAERGEDVAFASDERHVFFRAQGRTMISRLLEGAFPNYEKVIPSGNKLVYPVAREELLAAIRRVAILASERSRAVKVVLGSDKIELSTESPELGDANEYVPYKGGGEKIETCLNAQYVADFLAAADTEEIELRLKDTKTQALFVPRKRPDQAFEETDYRYVIMPMRS